MWSIVLRTVAALFGLLLLATFFLYGDEEQSWHEALVVWWVKLETAREQGVRRQVAFMQQVAKSTSEILTRAFGEKLFSAKAVAVSANLSMSSFMLASIILVKGVFSLPLPLPMLIVVLLLFAYVGIARAQAPDNGGPAHLMSLLAICIALALPAFAEAVVHSGTYPAGFILGIASDLAFIPFTRWVLSKVGRCESVGQAFVLLCANALIAIAMVSGYIWHVVAWINFDPRIPHQTTATQDVLFFASATDFPAVLISLLFALVAAIVLTFRAAFPSLSRTFHVLHRDRLLQKRTWVAASGLALLAYALHGGGTDNWFDWMKARIAGS